MWFKKKNKIWVTNGFNSVFIDIRDVPEYKRHGYHAGFSEKPKISPRIQLFNGAENVLKYAHVHDAGADIILQKDICLEPGMTIVPLSFNIELPPGVMGLLFPRSSIAGMGITFNCAPIDSEYTGEYHLICYNVTDKDIKFSKGTKILQLVIVPCIHIDGISTGIRHRNSNGIGSTNN